MIDPNRVEEILKDCLYTDEEYKPGEEVPKGTIIVQGIMNRFGFNPKKVEVHKEEIESMLDQLPIEFFLPTHRQGGGGGWSFLNACNTKGGEQWTGLHLRMDQLFSLGQAIDLVHSQLPRSMWEHLPGGMPYYSIGRKVSS